MKPNILTTENQLHRIQNVRYVKTKLISNIKNKPLMAINCYFFEANDWI